MSERVGSSGGQFNKIGGVRPRNLEAQMEAAQQAAYLESREAETKLHEYLGVARLFLDRMRRYARAGDTLVDDDDVELCEAFINGQIPPNANKVELAKRIRIALVHAGLEHCTEEAQMRSLLHGEDSYFSDALNFADFLVNVTKGGVFYDDASTPAYDPVPAYCIEYSHKTGLFIVEIRDKKGKTAPEVYEDVEVFELTPRSLDRFEKSPPMRIHALR